VIRGVEAERVLHAVERVWVAELHVVADGLAWNRAVGRCLKPDATVTKTRWQTAAAPYLAARCRWLLDSKAWGHRVTCAGVLPQRSKGGLT
jgi:hypothetical protein